MEKRVSAPIRRGRKETVRGPSRRSAGGTLEKLFRLFVARTGFAGRIAAAARFFAAAACSRDPGVGAGKSRSFEDDGGSGPDDPLDRAAAVGTNPYRICRYALKSLETMSACLTLVLIGGHALLLRPRRSLRDVTRFNRGRSSSSAVSLAFFFRSALTAFRGLEPAV